MYAVNHCDMRDEIKRADMNKEDVQEMVMERVGQIVAGTLKGAGPGNPHEFPGVELLAVAVANGVIEAGAATLASDFELDLEELKTHAASEHISSC